MNDSLSQEINMVNKKSDLRNILQLLEKSIMNQEKILDKMQDYLIKYQLELEEKEELIATLKMENHEILSSNCWKLTQPYRSLTTFLHRKITTFKKNIKNNIKSLSLNMQGDDQLFAQLFAHAINDKKDYIPFNTHPSLENPVKLIALYLPQFHPIPENDQWWGKGFTEWTNVSKAVPQFLGHYQPHLPGELGFYDLRLKAVQKRQIELAKNYGLHGFCYHYYWFSGKKLLSHPLNTVLQDPSLDLPFCLCWANENWTRRWDGLDQEILIEQRYNPEDDISFIKEIEPILRDPRYIRIEGKPLLVIYNISQLPDLNKTLNVWKDYCASNGIGTLYLVAAKTFELTTCPLGFDALMEYPPHQIICSQKIKLKRYNPAYSGRVINYKNLLKRTLKNPPSRELIRTAFPSWDNEARKPGKGTTFVGSSPALYQKWLEQLITYTKEQNQSNCVFVNAWNEWAEGAHLEPDRRYGYAWLEATYQALKNTI